MSRFTYFLFPKPTGTFGASMLIVFLRVALGILILTHGLDKCIHFESIAPHFPNPLGVGSEASLILVIFAEVICACGLITGFLYRLSLIPLMFSFSMIVFVVMKHAPFAQKELPLVYLICLVGLFFTGAGRYSIDYLIHQKLIGKTE